MEAVKYKGWSAYYYEMGKSIYINIIYINKNEQFWVKTNCVIVSAKIFINMMKGNRINRWLFCSFQNKKKYFSRMQSDFYLEKTVILFL